jgi:DNA invertase Pin-like site-specific DNA recombinase
MAGAMICATAGTSMSEWSQRGNGVYLQQGLDTTTPSGKAMFQMMGVFAEFERAIIQERVRAGLARVKAEGKTLGRPRIDAALEASIRKALHKGDLGIRKIAVKLGVATGTVQRVRAEMAV